MHGCNRVQRYSIRTKQKESSYFIIVRLNDDQLPHESQIQAKYPRVVESVARKIESLRVDQPSVKVLPWERIRQIVKDEVNPLLSERQLSYIFKCLANAGVVSLMS